MKLVNDPVALTPCVVVLGMFDGVHVGHQALLKAGRELADRRNVPLCVCTFEPHPLEVLRPELAPPRLTLPEERAELMAACGVDILSINTFTRTVADQMPEDFLQHLEETCGPAAVVCGFNFSYGRAGMGKPEHLAARGAAKGYEVRIVPCVQMDGETVSSTRIRGLLASGRISEAERLLGHAFPLSGSVTREDDSLYLVTDEKKALPGDDTYPAVLTADETDIPVSAVVQGGRVKLILPAGTDIRSRALAKLRLRDGMNHN